MDVKKLQPGPYGFSMLAMVLASSLLRIALISQNWPVTNSDEGVMDLMALHIAYQGEHPVFFYGQDYMGTLEAYVGAFLFQICGVSAFALRLGLIPFFAFFLISMYVLTRLLYNRRLALVTVILLSLGSSEIVTRQLKAIGGYPETFFFAALIFLLSSKIALSSTAIVCISDGQERRRRYLLYALLGFVVGLALWIDQLILPFIATAGFLLLLFCRRELFSLAGLSALLGIMLGALPLIYYNLTNSFEHNSLFVLLNLQRSGIGDLTLKHIPRIQQLVGAFLISLPAITGLNPLCGLHNFPLFGSVTAQNLHCTLVQGAWSLGYVALWLWAASLAGCAARRSFSHTSGMSDFKGEASSLQRKHIYDTLRFWWHYGDFQSGWPSDERRECIKQCARLLLLLSAAFSFILYATSPGAALSPTTNTRYLIGILVALPAVLWPLWHASHKLRGLKGAGKRRLFSFLLRGGILLLIFSLFANGMVGIIADIPNAQASYARQQAFIGYLERIGATHIYTDYWTCYRLAFQSNEHIICAPLTEDLKLRHGPESVNRYPPYTDRVQAVSQPTYVFPRQSIQAANFARHVRAHTEYYMYSEFDNYAIYQYTTSIGIPYT